MDSSTLLLIHNIGYIFSSILLLFLTALVYFKDHSSMANKMIILAFLASAIFTISHVIGVNITDSYISWKVLMVNTVVIYLSCFYAHGIIAFLGKDKKQWFILFLMYFISTVLFVIHLIYPETYLRPSEASLYFPNYYVAGSLHWLFRIFANIVIPGYFLIEMFKSYKGANPETKNRLKYFFTGSFLGFAFGGTAVPLIFGFEVDPIWSIFFVPLFAIPFSYAILKYDLLDIRVVAKQAFIYAVLIGLVGIFSGVFNYLNNLVISLNPAFPLWIFPLLLSILIVSIGVLIWQKLRETDVLKYEFITVATHKFRTPLTEIKWSAENLRSAATNEEREQFLQKIEISAHRLVELTNVLVNLSESDSSDFSYKLKPLELTTVAADVVQASSRRLQEKNLRLNLEKVSVPPVLADENKIRTVLQMLIDNAIAYTPVGGEINVSFIDEGNASIVAVKDNGIGIPKNELPLMFNKFFRGVKAKELDTEGVGVGLFLSKQMIERQGGKMWAQSEGEGKGTTFFIRLPMYK